MPAFTHYKTITIDYTKCGSSDSTNFPLALCITDNDLKTTPTGKVTSASGYDIRPYDSARATALDYELVSYNASTGTIEMHVRIPTLNHLANTVITLCFGDASLTSDGSVRTTWNSNFLGVWHFGDGTTLSLSDSSQSALTGTNHGASATTGQVGGAIATAVGALGESVSSAAIKAITTAVTLELWFKPTNLTQTNRWIFSHSSGGRTNANWSMTWEWTNNAVEFYGGSYIYGLFSGGPTSVLTAPDANWHHYAYTFNGTQYKRYLDGALIGTGTVASSTWFAGGATDTITFGGLIWELNTSTDPVAGSIDEARVSNVVRDDAWMISTFNNHSSGSGNFYTVGALTATQTAMTVTGAISTIAGACAKAVTHLTTGSIATITGACTKAATRTMEGAIATIVGQCLRTFGYAATGALATITGAVVRASAKAVDGAVAPGSTLARATTKGTSGSVATTGDPVKAMATLVGGSCTPAGTPVKASAKAAGGTVAPTADLTANSAQTRTFTGAISSIVGACLRQTVKTTSGAATSAGTVAKSVGVTTAGTLSSLGAIAKAAARALSGSLSGNGDLSAGSVTALTLSGALSGIVGSIVRAASLGRGGTVTPTSTLGRATAKTATGSVTPLGAAVTTRAILRTLTGLIASAGNAARSTFSGRVRGPIRLLKGAAKKPKLKNVRRH